jgi:hypothetical protein
MAKVKSPIKAALARFVPIYNHLNAINVVLAQAGYTEDAHQTFPIRKELKRFEKELRALTGNGG